jgi:hypothetical protein
VTVSPQLEITLFENGEGEFGVGTDAVQGAGLGFPVHALRSAGRSNKTSNEAAPRMQSVQSRSRQPELWVPLTALARAPNDASERRPSHSRPQRRTAPPRALAVCKHTRRRAVPGPQRTR